ncbi:hypothetical protein HPP92_016100 [Vanilla planifolia]|uniref:Uncharacterized protein n=1 Tax=Vanilla planifolia TaxID=51239 RepID=A0A835QTF3_VANPL|nr:hypothetical protein HPP92_016100 [Vanilla planifolia]
MVDFDDFGELYSDLEVQAIAVPAVAEEDRNKSESEENEAQRAHGTVEWGAAVTATMTSDSAERRGFPK